MGATILQKAIRTARKPIIWYTTSIVMQADMFHTDGGAETFAEWIRRGPCYHFRWPKDAMENSTRASVNFKFSRPFDAHLQHQVMLFSQWNTAYKITHKHGRMQVAELKEL